MEYSKIFKIKIDNRSYRIVLEYEYQSISKKDDRIKYAKIEWQVYYEKILIYSHLKNYVPINSNKEQTDIMFWILSKLFMVHLYYILGGNDNYNDTINDFKTLYAFHELVKYFGKDYTCKKLLELINSHYTNSNDKKLYKFILNSIIVQFYNYPYRVYFNHSIIIKQIRKYCTFIESLFSYLYEFKNPPISNKEFTAINHSLLDNIRYYKAKLGLIISIKNRNPIDNISRKILKLLNNDMPRQYISYIDLEDKYLNKEDI